ncbi:MAG: Flp family type IVb pilin [Bdellovibrionota bacterium]|jgi:Flp pilus assembly pilin Flp
MAGSKKGIYSNRRECGATAVEYAIGAACILVIVATGVVSLGNSIKGIFCAIGTKVSGTTSEFCAASSPSTSQPGCSGGLRDESCEIVDGDTSNAEGDYDEEPWFE